MSRESSTTLGQIPHAKEKWWIQSSGLTSHDSMDAQ